MLIATKSRLCFFSLILALTPAVGFALKSDLKLPCSIQSDQAVFYQNRNQAVFTGHIIVTQGTSKMTGDKVILYLDKTNKKAIRIIAYGQPATYTTQLDGEKEPMQAKADIINYYPTKAIVTLQKHAKIKQHGDSITGDYIKYDLNKQIVSSNSNKKTNDKTTIIIQPKNMW